jgi:uncharacterized iron-regulated membrane protein
VFTGRFRFSLLAISDSDRVTISAILLNTNAERQRFRSWLVLFAIVFLKTEWAIPYPSLHTSMSPVFFRKWHRWIGFPAALFLLFAAVTGVLVACYEFFGEEEALREATRALVSPVTTHTLATASAEPLRKVFATAAAQSGESPVDRVTIEFKGDHPSVTIYTGKSGGGEDRKLVFDAATGALVRNAAYVDKPLIHRIHSGEAFGDGGLVFAMCWGCALALLSGSGIVIYFQMRRPISTGLKRLFW